LLATEGAAHFWLDKDFYYIAPNNPKIWSNSTFMIVGLIQKTKRMAFWLQCLWYVVWQCTSAMIKTNMFW
jgi:hypothetical protein